MKLCITGAAGQLGSQLCEDLASGKTELGKIPEAFVDAEVIAIDIASLDITDAHAVTDFFAEARPDIIINCAAMTNVDGCETNPEMAMQVNAIGTRNLAAAAEAIGAKFIHLSTDYVFAGDDPNPRSEWDFADPISVYGKSKLLGEQYVREQCKRYFIVRTAWLYGYYGKNFVKTMLRVGKEKGALTVVSDQVGSPTNAADLSHHLLTLAATEEYGVYHCTNHGECSWFTFAKKIMELSGVNATVSPCTSEEYPTPTKRPAYSKLDNLMLRSTMGDKMRDWEEALTYYFTQYKEDKN